VLIKKFNQNEKANQKLYIDEKSIGVGIVLEFMP